MAQPSRQRKLAAGKPPRRTAFVTGASTGIGAAIAIELAREGWDLVISATSLGRLAETARATKDAGARTTTVALDLRSLTSVEGAVAEVFNAHERLDVLVNNAGVTLRKPALEVTVDEWETVMQTNLRGTFFLCQQVGRRWVEQKAPAGCIINVTSAHGVVGFPNRSIYGMSKAGLIQMTRMLAIEWADHGIRVNAIAPGTVDTPSRAQAFAEPAAKKIMLDRIPLHRFATMDEVAGAVSFLAGPHAAYMTGQTMLLDGGVTAY